MIKDVSDAFKQHPFAAMLLALLALSVLSHYRTRKQFTKVCGLIEQLQEGYWELADFGGIELSRGDISISDVVMERVRDHARLMAEDSREGRGYRWRFRITREIERTCGSRGLPRSTPAEL